MREAELIVVFSLAPFSQGVVVVPIFTGGLCHFEGEVGWLGMMGEGDREGVFGSIYGAYVLVTDGGRARGFETGFFSDFYVFLGLFHLSLG